MFSGIIEELGVVKRITHCGNIARIEIGAGNIIPGVKIGESVSVNGACLTVVAVKNDSLVFEAIAETLKVTNLRLLKTAEMVNLERSLRVTERVSGHFVLGHVDCLGIIRSKDYRNGNLSFQIAIPPGFIKYCLPKGSIAVDGISLTIADRKSTSIFLYIIPHTLKNTTLGFKGPSGRVNIEFDTLVKAAQRS